MIAPIASPPPAAEVWPDYAGGSLVNLMQTLQDALQASPADYRYAPLRGDCGLPADAFADLRHVLLLILDGLGAAQLDELAPDSWLARQQVGTLTTVYPSTTASAIPCLLSGLAPQQHGLPGWHMRDEIGGEVIATLPLTMRDPRARKIPAGELLARLVSYRPLAERLPGSGCTVLPDKIAASPFNHRHALRGPTFGYRDIAGFGQAIESALRYQQVAYAGRPGYPTFTYAYCPLPDTLMHAHGTRHPLVAAALAELDRTIADRLRDNALPGLTVLVTADHGFIDAPPERLIEISAGGAHCEWLEFLRAPLCGERRVAYASVKPGREQDFVEFVRTRYADECELSGSADFVASGRLGPGPPHPALQSRIGDFVLTMREDWTIKDWLPGEERHTHLGVHGGGSDREMRIPLMAWRP